MTYQLYTHVRECEEQLLSKCKIQDAELQASPLDVMMNLVMSRIPAKLAEKWGIQFSEFLGEFIENIAFLIKGLSRARDFDDVFQTIMAVTRFFTKKGFGASVSDLIAYFTKEADVQAFDFTAVRIALDNYDAVKSSPIVMKVKKLCSLALSSCLLQAAGLTSKIETLMKIYGEASQQMLADVDLVTGIIDLAMFIMERAAQCWHQGSLKPLFHSSKNYAKWATRSYEIIEQSQLMHNPEAHNLTYHGFLEDLEQAIDDGVQIQKFSQSADKKDVVLSVLSKLRILRGEILTRKAAGEERRAPFCMLVSGGSGVGKSSFTRMFFSHFGKMFKLPTGSEFLYTRCFTDEYWSGFRSQMWGILMDDIAFVNPNKGTEDRSLSELLQIANNVAYCPPQAAIEDKGKTPIRAECVIGTTNTVHLNAQYWFSNPVAVRRRFPYVVTLTPKAEFARSDAPAMLDPEKVPIPDSGAYPDIWNIKLEKVIVYNADGNGTQETESLLIGNYSDVYDFMQVMSGFIREFRMNQSKAASNDMTLSTVTLCCVCDMPKKHCRCESSGEESDCDAELQGRELLLPSVQVLPPPTWEAWEETRNPRPSLGALGLAAAAAALKQHNQQVIFTSAARAARSFTKEFVVSYLKKLGSKVIREVCNNTYLKMALSALGIFSTGYAAYLLYKQNTVSVAQSQEVKSELNSFGKTPPSTGDEAENFYHQKGDYRASLVTSEQSRSWRSLEWSAICTKFSNSMVAIRVTRVVGGKAMETEGRAACLGGRLYVTDNHIIPNTECVLEVVREAHASGLTTNVTRVLDPSMLYRMPHKELVFFQLLDSFDCKSIVPFLSDSTFNAVCSGAMIARDLSGFPTVNHIKYMKSMGPTHVDQLDIKLDLWSYRLDAPTRVGLCGSLVVAKAPTGPVVVGLHVLGNTGSDEGWCLRLTLEDVKLAQQNFMPSFEPGAPMLNSSVRDVGVTPLHDKSVFRFIGRGVGKVFGKLTVPMAQPKTSVCATVFREKAVEEGFVVNAAAPVMRGKKMWRQAVLPIVEQKCLMLEGVISKCAHAYVDEIMAHLGDRDLAELCEPLSLEAAINGIPGRKYIDSINRGTSAGFPWMKTKKSVTVTLPANEIWSDPIDVNDEVKERAETMLNRYLNSETVGPIFTAHLKDEPLPMAKVLAQKTRVMNGAPLDWSLIVRMVYLPIVRVIQNNKILFEAMPGAVVQTTEWDDIYKSVSKYGTTRMIAGDYKAFDKGMGAVIIMHAFWCLIEISKRAGATEDTQKVMWGIAHDTSTSYTNFNGDLVQFLGSNPSGHPLTVIINCVVNSLYMRYCYHELNPDKEVTSFRENVSLITYGDDNAMSSARDWFNHTSISNTLARVGIVYTMADKEAASVPFLPIEEISFLKRSWRFEAELGAMVAPIAHGTLDKMMTTWNPSDVMSPEAQGENIISAVMNEYFWYGREVFEAKKIVLRRIFDATIPHEYEKPTTFPSWESLITRWKVASGQLERTALTE